jgi:hypothetical protein
MSEFTDGNWPSFNGGNDFGVEDILNTPMHPDIASMDTGTASDPDNDPELIFAARDIARDTAEAVLFELKDAEVTGLPEIMDKIHEIDAETGGTSLHIQDAGISFRKEAAETDDPEKQVRLSNLADLSSVITLIATARFIKAYGDTEEDDLFATILDAAEAGVCDLEISDHDYSAIKYLINELKPL